jgi:very-short-patch-repair endonuclease
LQRRPESSAPRRRDLRQQATTPEQILWYALRNRQVQGLKFRRQHSIGLYVVDFYCADAQLAVEIDGDTHGEDS